MKKFILFILFLITTFNSVISQDDKTAKDILEHYKKEQEDKWYNKIFMSGFVDVYYNYTFNNKQGNQVNSAGTFQQYNKQFAVNAVELDIEKIATKDSPWGFRFDLQNGQNTALQERPGTDSNFAFNMNLLQQAHISMYIPFYKGVIVDAGKLIGHIGFDALESKDMYNYSIGYIFYNVPFINTGARAAFTLPKNWLFTFYLYNSAQGTGFLNPGASTQPPVDKLTNQSLVNTAYHNYADGLSRTLTPGTRINGDIIPQKLSMTWNLMYGNDNLTGREPNRTYYLRDLGNSNETIANPPSKFKNDFYFIHEIWFTFNPTKHFTFTLNWIHQIRAGGTASNNGAYVNDGIKIATEQYSITVARDDHNVRRINNSYAAWARYFFTDNFALGFRFEYFDDSRYGGSYVLNAPLAAQTPMYRYDLQYLDKLGLRKPSNLGQVRSLTITPTYLYTEHLIIKLDMRRDWALGEQFVDEQGKPSPYQNGLILGVVAKF